MDRYIKYKQVSRVQLFGEDDILKVLLHQFIKLLTQHIQTEN